MLNAFKSAARKLLIAGAAALSLVASPARAQGVYLDQSGNNDFMSFRGVTATGRNGEVDGIQRGDNLTMQFSGVKGKGLVSGEQYGTDLAARLRNVNGGKGPVTASQSGHGLVLDAEGVKAGARAGRPAHRAPVRAPGRHH